MSELNEHTYKTFKAALETLEIHENDVVIYRFPPNSGPEELQHNMDVIREVFPNNQVLGLCDDEDVLVANPKEAIDMLERMIAKIQLLEGTPKSGIIIP